MTVRTLTTGFAILGNIIGTMCKIMQSDQPLPRALFGTFQSALFSRGGAQHPASHPGALDAHLQERSASQTGGLARPATPNGDTPVQAAGQSAPRQMRGLLSSGCL